jgi:fused signal recognition particle receptor
MFGNIFSKFKKGLTKTSSEITEGIKGIFTSGKIDNETCEQLEELLIQADMGVDTALKLTERLRKHKFEKNITEEEIRKWLAGEIAEILTPCEQPLTLPDNKPNVIMMVGVNGSGKTTTIGKLSAQYKNNGKKVMLAAGDTFRAGAVAQLEVWANRAKVEIIKPNKEGADPAGVIFGAYEKAQQDSTDILICDTAGRLQNRKDLMEQLSKMVRVIKKHDNTAPHETILVLDATVGQNAMSQVETFMELAGVTGLIITKLDSSAKGGVVVALAEKFKLPIYYIGIGEKIEDLRPFEAVNYAKALLDIE